MKRIETATAPPNNEDEKRRYQRYENHSISIQVSRPGIKGIIRANPSGTCLNFSRTGLQFDCAQPLDVNEELVIDITVDDLILRDLSGTVVSRRQLGDGNWCHGIRFHFEKSRMKKDEIYRKLLLIEENLKLSAEFPI